MESDNPPKQLPVSTQEVRFATTMTGGVSLAIWMAGVAREINLLGHHEIEPVEPFESIVRHEQPINCFHACDHVGNRL